MPGAGAGGFESPFNLEKSAHVCPVDGEAPALPGSCRNPGGCGGRKEVPAGPGSGQRSMEESGKRRKRRAMMSKEGIVRLLGTKVILSGMKNLASK